MEMQIQDLVSSIKKDGIEQAQKKADAIIKEANEKAEAIINKALKEADDIVSKANKESSILLQGAVTGAKQAQRDAVLSFKKQIQQEYERILTSQIRKTFDETSLATLIRYALGENNPKDYTVEIANVSESLKSALAKEIKEGLEIKVSKKCQFGFRLSAKDNSGYFDCSDEAIEKMLAPFFSNLEV